MSARVVICAQKQWQKHCTNLKHLLQQSIAHKINVEILKEKYKKISVLLQQLMYEINDKYTSYKNLRNLLRQLLSCKISHQNQISYLWFEQRKKKKSVLNKSKY